MLAGASQVSPGHPNPPPALTTTNTPSPSTLSVSGIHFTPYHHGQAAAGLVHGQPTSQHPSEPGATDMEFHPRSHSHHTPLPPPHEHHVPPAHHGSVQHHHHPPPVGQPVPILTHPNIPAAPPSVDIPYGAGGPPAVGTGAPHSHFSGNPTVCHTAQHVPANFPVTPFRATFLQPHHHPHHPPHHHHHHHHPGIELLPTAPLSQDHLERLSDSPTLRYLSTSVAAPPAAGTPMSASGVTTAVPSTAPLCKKQKLDTEAKRQIHILSEQKRRAIIKDAFAELENELIPLNRGRKPSKIQTLQRSVEIIKFLKGNQEKLVQEIDVMRKEREHWKGKCVEMARSTGVPISPPIPSSMLSMHHHHHHHHPHHHPQPAAPAAPTQAHQTHPTTVLSAAAALQAAAASANAPQAPPTLPPAATPTYADDCTSPSATFEPDVCPNTHSRGQTATTTGLAPIHPTPAADGPVHGASVLATGSGHRLPPLGPTPTATSTFSDIGVTMTSNATPGSAFQETPRTSPTPFQRSPHSVPQAHLPATLDSVGCSTHDGAQVSLDTQSSTDIPHITPFDINETKLSQPTLETTPVGRLVEETKMTKSSTSSLSARSSNSTIIVVKEDEWEASVTTSVSSRSSEDSMLEV